MTELQGGAEDESRFQLVRSFFAVSTFAISLAATSLLYPIVAIDAGFGASVVGLLTAVSAALQLGSRAILPWVLGRAVDRSIASVACLALAISVGMVILDRSLGVLIVAQAIQGCSRGFFWTAMQSHFVRAPGTPLNRLAQLAVAGKVGSLVGPAIAGVTAARSMSATLIVTLLGACVAAAASGTMTRLPPYDRPPRTERQSRWREPRVAAGNSIGFAAGVWRGMMDSFVPVVLTGAGIGVGMIGLLYSLTECADLVASAWLSRMRGNPFAALGRLSGVAVITGALALPIAAGSGVVTAGLALAVAGFGSGLATTVGLGLATDVAPPGETGTALASVGAYRSAGRMIAPSAASAMTGLFGAPVALATITFALVSPSYVLGRSGNTVDSPQ